MRERGIPLPRQEDVVGRHERVGCVDFEQLFRKTMKYTLHITHDFFKGDIKLDLFMYELRRFFFHLGHTIDRPHPYSEGSFQELRVEYILNNITEDTFINTIIKQYKLNKYNIMMVNLVETFRYIIQDCFDKIDANLSNKNQSGLCDDLVSFFDFVTYYNKQVIEFRSLFGYKTHKLFTFIENSYGGRGGINTIDRYEMDL
jgi:hypothetical protein